MKLPTILSSRIFEKSSVERVVKEMIRDGYMPLGGIGITYAPNYFNSPMGVIVFSQAMVKYADPLAND